MAIVNQPLSGGMGTMSEISEPLPIPGVPKGLIYLTQVDQLVCEQMVDMLEVSTWWEIKNKFRILNSTGPPAYYAFEEPGECHRQCCGSDRGFIFHITDNLQREVLTVERPFQCCKSCRWCADGCCRYPAYVKDAQGKLLGTVQMEKSCCTPHFGIYDANDEKIYGTQGPVCHCPCVCGCRGDRTFPLKEVNTGVVLANISKIWDGVVKDMCKDADTFQVSFPMNLDVIHKALMIGAMFVIGVMVFENCKKNDCKDFCAGLLSTPQHNIWSHTSN